MLCCRLLLLVVLTAALPFAASAASEIVLAIRYLQAEGTSHAHLYLYREDGKLLRQLTNDNSGQDIDPIFNPDGETIVFTRELKENGLEYWSVTPTGKQLKRLEAAPAWYVATGNAAFFTNSEIQPEFPETDPSPGSSTPTPSPPAYRSPDESVEIVLRTVSTDVDDSVTGEGHGKHYLLRDLKSGKEVEMGQLPGFLGLWDMLEENNDHTKHFLIEPPLRLAFFALHLDSTDGDTSFALDLNNPRFVRLSPNYAAPVPLPGEPAFLTCASVRYVPIPGSKKTANCNYIERWDENLNKVRYAREGVPALCYGASLYRPGKMPSTINIRRVAR